MILYVHMIYKFVWEQKQICQFLCPSIHPSNTASYQFENEKCILVVVLTRKPTSGVYVYVCVCVCVCVCVATDQELLHK
jgi:hypothetical protein